MNISCIKIIKILIFMILITIPAFSATTYYVDAKSGSDSNPGTQAQPWKTLAKAVSSISSGDTVYLRGGTWQDEQLNISFKNYTSTTTFKNYPGETPIIDMRNSGTGSGAKAIYLDHSDHLHIQGITVRNSGNKAINADTCDNLIIMSCTSEHSRYAGIYIANCDTFTVSYNTVKWTQCAYGDHDHDQWTSFGEECISIAEESTNGDVHHNSISHGTTADAGGEGLNIKNGCSYIYVHHNIVDQLRDDGLEGRRYCMGVDGWTHETHHIYFYNNILKNGSWGLQYNSEEGGYTHHIYGWNNIITHIGHNKHGGGIGMPNYGGSPGLCQYCYFWNNTIYDCYYGAYFTKTNIGAPIEVRNNIFASCSREVIEFAYGVPSEKITLDHNLTSGDPRFVNANGGDFHLRSDSPAIDAGIAVSRVTHDFDGVARPQYTGYDIGAYEYEYISSYLILHKCDFTGDGRSDISVWRPGNGTWHIKDFISYHWGETYDIPVSGDYNDNGQADIAVWRPSNGRWYIKDIATHSWGMQGDIPVPGDYDGNGQTDIAVWRRSSGRWLIKDIGNFYWGLSGDIPVPGDYNGNGKTDIAVWRRSNGRWLIKDIGNFYWGLSGDIPVPGDYNGDGKTDIAVWRPSNGRWYIIGVGNYYWGQLGDIPVPGDYNGDGITDIAVWRSSIGRWFIKNLFETYWGQSGDIPLVR